MPKAKPYFEPINADLAVQVLNATGVREGEDLLGDALRIAAEKLERLVHQANKGLKDNEFAAIVAEHLSMKMSRRGVAHLTVSEVGTVLLHISYEEAKPVPVFMRQRTAPLMKELKARASELGVDISPFGIKRKLIHAFLEDVAKGTAPLKKESAKPKTTRTKPVVRVAQDPPELDPGPMSAGADETTISPPPETLPFRQPIVKNRPQQEGPIVVDAPVVDAPVVDAPVVDAPVVSVPNGAKSLKLQSDPPKGRSLRQLATEAKDFDIADLLASESPK